jgi:hypothetical protein
MYKKMLLVFLLVFLLVPVCVWAQTGIITGRVTDGVTGNPLPGANIIVVGTQLGAASDLQGTYTIENVPVGTQTVRITFVGFKPQESQLQVTAGRSVLNFVLEADLLRMDEIVVTALGILREERSIGYSIQSVSGDELVGSRESNIVNALAAKAAGSPGHKFERSAREIVSYNYTWGQLDARKQPASLCRRRCTDQQCFG